MFAYSGAQGTLVVGYIVGALSGGLLSPSLGALLTELFPTSVRASVTGWSVTAGVVGAVCGLVVFGAVADVGNRFALAAEVTFLPMVAAAALFWLLPRRRDTNRSPCGRPPSSPPTGLDPHCIAPSLLEHVRHNLRSLRGHPGPLPMSEVPPQGAYLAKTCPHAVQLDILQPCEPLPRSSFMAMLGGEGRDFEAEVFELLLAVVPDAVTIDDDLSAAHGRH